MTHKLLAAFFCQPPPRRFLSLALFANYVGEPVFWRAKKSVIRPCNTCYSPRPFLSYLTLSYAYTRERHETTPETLKHSQ